MRRALLLGLGFLLLLPVPAPAQQAEPAAVQRFRNDMIRGCRDSGGGQARIEPGFLRRADISRDGVPDYVLDASKVNCPGAMTFTCGSAGCPVQVIVSQGGRHVVALDSYAQEIRVEPGAGGDVVVVNGRRMAWDGARLVAAGAGAPAARAAPPAPPGQAAPTRGGAWRVVLVDGQPRAEAPGTGQIRNVMMLCSPQRGAVIALGLHRPIAPRAGVTIEVGNFRAIVPFQRFAPDMLFWDADGQPLQTLIPLFSSASGEALLSVGGQPLGTLPLAEARPALERALARCHRFPAR